MKIQKSILFGALVACGAAMAASTNTTPTASANSSTSAASTSVASNQKDGRSHHFHHEGSPFFHALHELNLTPEQQTTIKGYFDTARQQASSNDASRPDITVIANPGNPNYGNAIAAAKANAAAHIQKTSDLEVQVYGILTAEQKAKLPQVLANLEAQRGQRHGDRHDHHDHDRDQAPASKG